MERNYYTLKELSGHLDISIRSLREYIRMGMLDAQKNGRYYIVTQNGLKKFIDAGFVISRYGIGSG